MGCFDAVLVSCPNCSTELEFQSKAGECSQYTYDIDAVPVTIALDLHNEVRHCPKCNKAFALKYKKQKLVKMRLIAVT
jgi:endogenous inhibitor of DNA gyrase (YacG/DUF329 family)